MKNLLESLGGKSKTIFIIAAILLIINAIGAGLNAFADAAIGLKIKEVFQVAGYGTAFVGGLALYTSLSDENKWLARIGAILTGLGVIGSAVLLIGVVQFIVENLASTPAWSGLFGVGIPLGQIGLLLLGIAALRSDAYTQRVGLALMGPMFAFIIFFAGAGIGNAVLGGEPPIWVPFIIVCLQTIAHLMIAFVMPENTPQTVRQGTQQPLTA